jgi:rhamnosyltransferase
MEPEPFLDVVVRCKDEMPFVVPCLAALGRQMGCRARVLFLDCGSKDGSREAAVDAGATILDIDPARYIPGAVLNFAMERTHSPIVAFVNADAIPLRNDALTRLVAPLLEDHALACTFGRQVARPDAAPRTRADYERAFGPRAAVQVRRGAFFSMAASAVRRSAWDALPFDAALRYSEDVDWTQRLTALGYEVGYVPEAGFEHSHDYDLRAQLRRRIGEGAADTAIHHLGAPGFLGDLARPLAGCLLRDARSGSLSLDGTADRAAQAIGYFVGRARAARELSRAAAMASPRQPSANR